MSHLFCSPACKEEFFTGKGQTPCPHAFGASLGPEPPRACGLSQSLCSLRRSGLPREMSPLGTMLFVPATVLAGGEDQVQGPLLQTMACGPMAWFYKQSFIGTHTCSLVYIGPTKPKTFAIWICTEKACWFRSRHSAGPTPNRHEATASLSHLH